MKSGGILYLILHYMLILVLLLQDPHFSSIYPALYIFRLKLFFKTVSKFEYNRLFLTDHNFQSIFTATLDSVSRLESDVTRYPH